MVSRIHQEKCHTAQCKEYVPTEVSWCILYFCTRCMLHVCPQSDIHIHQSAKLDEGNIWSSCWKFAIQIIQICHVACNFSDIQILFIEGPAASQKLGPSIQYKDLEWKYWTKCSLFGQKRTRNSKWCAHWILTVPLLFDTQYMFLCVFSFFKQSIVRFVTQHKINVISFFF